MVIIRTKEQNQSRDIRTTNVKLIYNSNFFGSVETTVEHVVMHVFCELEGHSCFGTVDDYILKPIGINEWLQPTSKLSQLDCVHQSIKLEQDVQLGLWPRSSADLRALARTERDDNCVADIKMEHIVVNEAVEQINYNNLTILLETLENEIDKLELNAAEHRSQSILSQSHGHIPLHTGVVQAVKMICALFGSIDTININAAIENLNRTGHLSSVYDSDDPRMKGGIFEVNSDIGDYTEVKIRPKTQVEQIKHSCDRIREAVESLIDTFSHAFRVNFSVNKPLYHTNPISIKNVHDPVVVHIQCLHRTPPHWKHEYYMLAAQIYHGTRYISDAAITQCANEKSGLFDGNLKFDTWLQFDNIPVSTLPRESRLMIVLYGCTTEPADNAQASAADVTDSMQNRMVTKVELGWSSIQFFDFERKMIEGEQVDLARNRYCDVPRVELSDRVETLSI